MKQQPDFRLVTFRATDQSLIEIDTILKSGDFANRTEIIRESVVELIVDNKFNERFIPKKKKTPFKDYVQEIKKELGRAKF